MFWTSHSKFKMKFYQLSEARVRRVLNTPARVEEGIAPNTIAMMQPVSYKTKNGVKSWNQEIWVMIQKSKSKGVKVISAWKYPGKTKEGSKLPEAIRGEIREAMYLL
jgi:hypothetical protein